MPEQTQNCPKDCIYNHHSKNYFVNHWGFIACILIFTAITIAFFVSYSNSYKETQRNILELHEKYCTQFSPDNIPDSIIAYRDFRPIMDSYITSVSESLTMQYDKIQNDYTILSIWASVLMIIFLIFSIYSMFKIDEIQKQSRESLKLIDETYSEVRKKSNTLDEEVDRSMSKIQTAIEQKISEFSTSIETKSSELEKKMENYKRTVDQGAANNQQLFDVLSALIKGQARQTGTGNQSEISPENK